MSSLIKLCSCASLCCLELHHFESNVWMLHYECLVTPDLGVFLIVTAGECVDPLVSGLYASSFLASSRYNFLYSANFAKLYGKFLIAVFLT